MLPIGVGAVIHVAGGGTQRDVQCGDDEHDYECHEHPARIPHAGGEYRNAGRLLAGDRYIQRSESADDEGGDRQEREQEEDQRQRGRILAGDGHGNQCNDADDGEHHSVHHDGLRNGAHEATRAVHPTPGGDEHVAGIRGELGQRVAGQCAESRDEERHQEGSEGRTHQRGGSAVSSAGHTEAEREDRTQHQIQDGGHQADGRGADCAGPREPDAGFPGEPVGAERRADHQGDAGQPNGHGQGDVRQ